MERKFMDNPQIISSRNPYLVHSFPNHQLTGQIDDSQRLLRFHKEGRKKTSIKLLSPGYKRKLFHKGSRSTILDSRETAMSDFYDE